MNIKRFSGLYRSALLDDVIPFWMKNSIDAEYGGYLTSLDAQGNVYDTDKFVWLQGRQVWCFATLYNRVEAKQEWLNVALQGSRFLERHGRDAAGNWYFSLTRQGAPLIQPYNIFSDCYAAMAFGQLYRATGDATHRQIAIDTFYNILRRKDNPKGSYNKAVPATRPLQSFALPMVLCSVVLELEHILDPGLVEKTIREGIHKVMEVFYQPEHGLILENVTQDGLFSDSFDGRLVNPGHAMEAMWFVMDLSQRYGDSGTVQKATEITLATIELSWDKLFGGLFYLLDVKGRPPQQLEWDQKLWWVHIEALVSLLKGYLYTGNNKCLFWFEAIHSYAWDHFPDPEKGEWFGYLNRRGEILLPIKGGKWKGCYHLPRGLLECWKIMEAWGGL